MAKDIREREYEVRAVRNSGVEVARGLLQPLGTSRLFDFAGLYS